MAKDKGKTKFSKNDQNLSEIIADKTPLMDSGPDERASPARGYRKTND
jgi:hypothetical protein